MRTKVVLRSKDLKLYLKDTLLQIDRYFSGDPDEGIEPIKARVKILKQNKVKIKPEWIGLD